MTDLERFDRLVVLITAEQQEELGSWRRGYWGGRAVEYAEQNGLDVECQMRARAMAELRVKILSGTINPQAARRVMPRLHEDDLSGYGLTDPKHPDFHSAMSDVWDNREKGI